MEIKVGVKVPNTPNFIRLDDGKSMGIETFSDDELKQIGTEWTQELIQRAKEIRGYNP